MGGLSDAAWAETQNWNDGGADNVWCTNAANWESGAVWTNGNSAVFAGAGGTQTGETVDVSATVTVANMTFLTNGYTIADADNDGTLTLVGTPVITVSNAGDTGTVSEAIAGSAGFTKMGNGQLRLTATNTFSGQTIVSNGTLRLTPNVVGVLGATGSGNETLVAAGATLDLNGCYASSSSSELFLIAGVGVDGKGALVNYGANHNNNSVGGLTLLGDATVNAMKRIDANAFYGNGHTLTKIGGEQFCVRNLTNAEIIINEGTYTLLDDNRALGGTTPGDTTMNAGTLNAWNTMSVPERITFNGGTIQEGNPNRQLFTLTGHLTLNNMVTINSSSITTGVEVAGFVDGSGGFTMNQGWIYVTGDTNTYSGPTVVNSGQKVYVGKTNLFSGVLGSGAVTNNGTVYGYSGLITKGLVVNNGTLNSYTGLLCSGSVVNNGNLYFDRGDAFTLTNAFSGTGTTHLRYNASMTVSGNASTNGGFRIGAGSLTLTNHAFYCFTGEMQIADRYEYSPADPTNVVATINVTDGCTLMSQAITFGNGNTVTGGGMTGILNQTGGTVYTTGSDGGREGNGIRLGHYPQAYCIYNMMGGTLIVGTNADLGCATDGRGWFNMTGGQVFTTRVMLNERNALDGSGRLTVAGGVLNVGSLSGNVAAISNAITADLYAPYLVEYGGAGGIVRAVTNLYLPLNATLYGTGTNAVTFDTSSFAIYQSGNLSGTGGLNKAGSGTLVLSGTNTYAGGTRILAGTVQLAAACVGPTGTVAFAVSTNGVGGVLASAGDLSLAGMTVAVANPEMLEESRSYTVASWSGNLAAPFGASALPGAWYVYYDWAGKTAQLRAAIGTVIRLR